MPIWFCGFGVCEFEFHFYSLLTEKLANFMLVLYLHKLRNFSQIYRFYARGDIILTQNKQKWPILTNFEQFLCTWCIK